MIVMLIAALPAGAQEAAGNMKLASPDSVVPVTPCGGCREVLLEAVRAQHNYDIRVVMADCTGELCRESRATELLPFAFEFK